MKRMIVALLLTVWGATAVADLTLDFENPPYTVGALVWQDGWNWVAPGMYGKVTDVAGKAIAGAQSAMIDVEGDNLWRDVYQTFVTGSRLQFKIKGENADFSFAVMNSKHQGTGAGKWYGTWSTAYPANHVIQCTWTWNLAPATGVVSYAALDLTNPSNVIPTTSVEVPGGGEVYGIEIRAYSHSGAAFWVSLDDVAFLPTPLPPSGTLIILE